MTPHLDPRQPMRRAAWSVRFVSWVGSNRMPLLCSESAANVITTLAQIAARAQPAITSLG